MTNTQVKTGIDTDITNKLTAASITPVNVGGRMKTVIDYIDQQINTVSIPLKTAGPVAATDISPYPILSFDLNSVYTTGSSDKVVLPTTTVIGKEVLIFALNNGAAFTVRGNQEGTSVLSSGGVSSTTGSISIAANISVKFIHLGNGFWKASAV